MCCCHQKEEVVISDFPSQYLFGAEAADADGSFSGVDSMFAAGNRCESSASSRSPSPPMCRKAAGLAGASARGATLAPRDEQFAANGTVTDTEDGPKSSRRSNGERRRTRKGTSMARKARKEALSREREEREAKARADQLAKEKMEKQREEEAARKAELKAGKAAQREAQRLAEEAAAEQLKIQRLGPLADPKARLQVQLDHGWVDMSKAESEQVCLQVAAGENRFTIQARGSLYIVHLTSPEKGIQQNATTGKSRPLRVVLR